jgi:signal transduction histidine kinase
MWTFSAMDAIHKYNILDTPRESDFDDIVKIASTVCNTRMSLISLLDGERLWYKAEVGLGWPESPAKDSFCIRAMKGDDMMVVNDATTDDRFQDNPYVLGDPHVRFYAGMPLIMSNGDRLGTLCVFDDKPHMEMTPYQSEILRVLSRQVINQLELRYQAHQLAQANDTIHRQNDALQNVIDSKNKMLSLLAHDLRNPLANMHSMVRLLRDGSLAPEQITDLAGMLDKSVAVSLDLLNNLVSWIRDQFESGEKAAEPVELFWLADKLLTTHHDQIISKGNRTENNIPMDTIVRTQRSGLEFILRNLILNANKFTKQGTIKIDYALEQGYHCITIEDTGMGMKASTLKDLFNWDKTVSTKGTDGEKGSGIGLKLCYELAAKMHGELRAESEEGKGTKFILKLRAE